MKKISILLFSIFVFLYLSFPSHAQTPASIIYEDYTSDGIYYVVYDTKTSVNQERTIGDTIDVIRKFEYNGIINPPSTRS